jgi:hypothetical protein
LASGHVTIGVGSRRGCRDHATTALDWQAASPGIDQSFIRARRLRPVLTSPLISPFTRPPSPSRRSQRRSAEAAQAEAISTLFYHYATALLQYTQADPASPRARPIEARPIRRRAIQRRGGGPGRAGPRVGPCGLLGDLGGRAPRASRTRTPWHRPRGTQHATHPSRALPLQHPHYRPRPPRARPLLVCAGGQRGSTVPPGQQAHRPCRR